MPDDIADKYLEFCESHNSDEVYDYLKRLYSYWDFKDTVDEDTDLTEVFPKEVTTVIYV